MRILLSIFFFVTSLFSVTCQDYLNGDAVVELPRVSLDTSYEPYFVNEAPRYEYICPYGNTSANYLVRVLNKGSTSVYVEQYHMSMCPDGTIANSDHTECIEPCQSTPPPQGKSEIPVHRDTSDAMCQGAPGQYYFFEGQYYTNLECWKDNCGDPTDPFKVFGTIINNPCSAGQDIDNNTYSCACPSGTSLHDGSCQSDNDGDSVPDSIDNDDDNDGIPDEYDDDPNTPIQNTYEDCNQLIRDKAVPCNTDYFDLKVNCTYTQNNVPYLTQNSCTPKPDIANPCVVKWEEFKLTCKEPNTPNYVSCNHNGISVINYDFECDQTGASPDTPVLADCRLSLNQVWSEELQNCVCDVGYTKNQFGSCWKDLEDNATAEQIKEDQKKQEEAFLDGQADKESTDKTNKIADNSTAQTQSLSNIENTLSGVRSDLNTTNDILSNIVKNLRGLDSTESTSENGGISDALAEAENLLQQRTDFFTTLKGQHEQAFTNLNNQWDSIQTQFSSTEAYFNQTRSFSFSSGRTDCFSGSFLGRSFTLDLCKYLSMIAPFVYFILTVSFSVITFVFVSKNIFKGFD